MSSMPKAVLATAVVVMFLAGMMIVPSYAAKPYNRSHSNTVNVVAKARRCPNGDLVPDNDVSKCPPLIPTQKGFIIPKKIKSVTTLNYDPQSTTPHAKTADKGDAAKEIEKKMKENKGFIPSKRIKKLASVL